MANQKLTTDQQQDLLLQNRDVKSWKIIGKPATRNRAAEVRVVIYQRQGPPIAQSAPTTQAAFDAVLFRLTFNRVAI